MGRSTCLLSQPAAAKPPTSAPKGRRSPRPTSSSHSAPAAACVGIGIGPWAALGVRVATGQGQPYSSATMPRMGAPRRIAPTWALALLIALRQHRGRRPAASVRRVGFERAVSWYIAPPGKLTVSQCLVWSATGFAQRWPIARPSTQSFSSFMHVSGPRPKGYWGPCAPKSSQLKFAQSSPRPIKRCSLPNFRAIGEHADLSRCDVDRRCEALLLLQEVSANILPIPGSLVLIPRFVLIGA